MIKKDLGSPDIPYIGHLLAGVDEAGRGPLAGDVVAAAVILDPLRPIAGLADSKKLTEKKREVLFDQIHQQALAVAIGRANVTEIDQLNILWASMLAMHRAVDALAIRPEFVVVDGNRLPKWDYSSQAVVKGDQRMSCISAASIIAKVTRDRDMSGLASVYPDYGFNQHKGYPTALHKAALARYGATDQHRKTFAPVKAVLDLA